MLLHILKTAWRNITHNKTFSAINIFGLAIGIACAGLIFLWVEDEMSWDDVFLKKEQLYVVRENQTYDAYTGTFTSTPGLLGPAMEKEIPGIASTCRASDSNDRLLFTVGDKSMYATGRYVEPSFFEMFSLSFVQGSAVDAFKQMRSLVISETASKKLFGPASDVIGKSVRINNGDDYLIAGVVKDMPANSSIQFEWLAPFDGYFQRNKYLENWGNNALTTYVELKPGTSAAAVDQQLFGFIEKRNPGSNTRPFLFSMKDWRLRDAFDNGKQTGGGRIEYIRLFSVIAWIIMLIACINFMNLATARSEKRAKEVGVRKTLGAMKRNLIGHFISESLLMALMASILSVVIMLLIMPAFNLLVQKDLAIGLDDPVHLSVLIGIWLVCGLLAGSYPALYLSSFRPVLVLKGLKLKTGGAEFVRKGLVVLQFTASIILIICTVVVYQQIRHAKERNLGFNINNLLRIPVNGDIPKNFVSIKEALLSSGYVDHVALSDHETIYNGNNTGSLTWEGKPTNSSVLISQRNVSEGFFNTSGMRLLEGRDLLPSDSMTANKTMGVVITKSFEKLLGQGSALGKIVRYEGDDVAMKVVGVVNNYVYGNFYGSADPVMFLYGRPEYETLLYVHVKPKADMEGAIVQTGRIMSKHNPGYPFEYKFVDELFGQMFFSEMLIGKLSRMFAALAILISCLGLFGLAAFTAEKRTKEIGIRKVFGASVIRVVVLLSKNFVKLVGIACLLAFPVAWWLMHHWLQGYPYRVGIHWWIFLASGASALGIALVTIGFQSVKAARANPVKSIKTE